jgi:hypothetical protein
MSENGKTSKTGKTNERFIAKMRLAVAALLSEPDEISDALEEELYALRDKLDVIELRESLQAVPAESAELGSAELGSADAEPA